jgi:hypothetical protein
MKFDIEGWAMSATVRNCPEAGACLGRWDRLVSGPDPSVRPCTRCGLSVSLCTTHAGALNRLRAGHLVAWAEPTDADLGRVYAEVGPGIAFPLALGPGTPEQADARRLRALGREVQDAMQNVRHASRACPGCGCPVPNYREGCRVCGAVLGRVYDADGNVLCVDRPV